MTTTELKQAVEKLPEAAPIAFITEGGTVCDKIAFSDETVNGMIIAVIQYPCGPVDIS